MSKSSARFIALALLLRQRSLDVSEEAIRAGRVIVDGRPVLNPAARVPATGAVRVLSERRLRGDIKLSLALDHLRVPISGRVAVDVGASAGGFTTALLRRGAARVYAIDAGFGQLAGRLRADPRVVNLEGHNIGALGDNDVPEAVDLITVDLSYLPLAEAVPQLERLAMAPRADLIALVKPTFELRLGAPPTDPAQLGAALHAAVAAVETRWEVVATRESSVRGRSGTTELFVHARRRPEDCGDD